MPTRTHEDEGPRGDLDQFEYEIDRKTGDIIYHRQDVDVSDPESIAKRE